MQQVEEPAERAPVQRGALGTAVRGVALGALTLALGVALGVGAGHVAAPEGSRAELASAPVERSVVLLSGGGVPVDQRAVEALDAVGVARQYPRAGYGTGRPALGQAVTQFLPDPDLDLLVVQGGELDAEAAGGNAVEVGALHLIDRVRAGTGPRTAVVLVGPLPDAGAPTRAERQVRDALQAAARQRGVPFLDPIALGWQRKDADLLQDFTSAVAPFVPQTS